MPSYPTRTCDEIGHEGLYSLWDMLPRALQLMPPGAWCALVVVGLVAIFIR